MALNSGQLKAGSILFLSLLSASALALDVQWTRMTGQYAVECSPLVADMDGDGQQEILAVNRGGQVMLWNPDGTDHGKGQDGTVAQLPEGLWCSSPTLVDASGPVRLLVCSKDGLIVGLGKDFSVVWQYQLPAATTFARAVPVLMETPGGTLCCIADNSGTVTALDLMGKPVWTRKLEQGPNEAPLNVFERKGEAPLLLVAAGSHLCGLTADGTPVWTHDLGGKITSRPEPLRIRESWTIVCGAAPESLFGLSADGQVLWKASVGDEMDSSIVLLPRKDKEPLILCLGLWGTLHAYDIRGRQVWMHEFRTKARCKPLICDVDKDGNNEIVVTTYQQRVYVFSHDGRILDDIRLNGITTGSPVAIVDSDSKETGFLTVTSSLLAHRLRFSAPKSPYGATGKAQDIRLACPELRYAAPSLVVTNPHGALLRVNVHDGNSETTWITGCVTARSAFEIPLRGTNPFRCTVSDSEGKLVADETFTMPAAQKFDSDPLPVLSVWPTPAYASFSDTQLLPEPGRSLPGNDGKKVVSIPNLYVGEVDQGAFIVAPTYSGVKRARITVSHPITADGVAFDGKVALFEVLPVDTINGEKAYDALAPLGDAGLLTFPHGCSAKVWVQVDAHGARPGTYTGKISIQTIYDQTPVVEMGLEIGVTALEFGKSFPLAFCTWDYVPNKWFPDDTAEVLDDMMKHGVSVFPRSECLPKATSAADGKLTFDWTPLDAELARLKGRGQILFQIVHPAITFAAPPNDADKRRAEIAYLRALRDYLKERGWDYGDYALYPVDEPGLDNGKNTVPTLIDAALLFREADPKFRIYTDPVVGLSWKDFQKIEPLIDVWCPNMRLVSGLLDKDPRIERILASGKPVWSYECIGQVKSISPLRYNRANAWRGDFFHLQGIGHWTHSMTPVDLWQSNKAAKDEYALVYPGKLPIPSVRWEAVRDGLEDVAAMTLLRQEIAACRAKGAHADRVAEAEEALRIALVDIMELSDAAFVESRDYLREGDRTILHTDTDVETYARHRARIAELTLALREK